MPKRLLRRGRTLISYQIAEIAANHKQCKKLIKARFRIILNLTVTFSLIQANRTIVKVCFYYKHLTDDELKSLEDWWIFSVLKLMFYLAPHLPAGRLSELYGAKWILFASVAGSGTCLGLMPAIIVYTDGTIYLQVLSYVNNFFMGFALPSTQVMLARWAIPSERILMASIVYSGFPLGKAVGMILSVWLCSSFGWYMAFYVFAGLSAIVVVFWAIFVHDDYASPRARITKQEKEVMARKMAREVYNYKDRVLSRVPVSEIMKSRPMWALLTAQLTLAFCESKYVTSVQHNIDKMMQQDAALGPVNHAVLLVQPYLLAVLVTWILGLVFFNLVTGQVFTKRGVYQAGCIISFAGVVITVILQMVEEEGGQLDMFSDQLAMGSLAGLGSTCFAPYLDMAPNYAGTITAIHNIIITISELLVFDVFERVEIVNFIGHWLLITMVLLLLFFYQFYVTDKLMKWNNYSFFKYHNRTTLKGSDSKISIGPR